MKDILLLLGTNVGNRHSNLLVACEKIGTSNINVIARSSVYETEPWGFKAQKTYYNQALIVKSECDPIELLDKLQRIEDEMGRKKNRIYGPRIIDIDILLFDNQIVNTEKLVIPHPHMHQRRFTLIPANEIGSEFIHPIFGLSISELLQECRETGSVNRIE